jgi:hypothetical protein
MSELENRENIIRVLFMFGLHEMGSLLFFGHFVEEFECDTNT